MSKLRLIGVQLDGAAARALADNERVLLRHLQQNAQRILLRSLTLF